MLFEVGDLLPLALRENPEISLLQAFHRVAIAVGNNDVHQHRTTVHSQGVFRRSVGNIIALRPQRCCTYGCHCGDFYGQALHARTSAQEKTSTLSMQSSREKPA